MNTNINKSIEHINYLEGESQEFNPQSIIDLDKKETERLVKFTLDKRVIYEDYAFTYFDYWFRIYPYRDNIFCLVINYAADTLSTSYLIDNKLISIYSKALFHLHEADSGYDMYYLERLIASILHENPMADCENLKSLSIDQVVDEMDELYEIFWVDDNY